jgi:hypothetical protein
MNCGGHMHATAVDIKSAFHAIPTQGIDGIEFERCEVRARLLQGFELS